MRYKVGAEQLELVPALARRPDGVFGSARTAPVGPPMRWTPQPALPPAGSRPPGWTCWTKTGKKPSSSRSALAVSPPSSPSARRGV